MTLHVTRRSVVTRMPPARRAFVPRPRMTWLPAYSTAEIEPRDTTDWIFVHKLEVVDEGGNDYTEWVADDTKVTGSSDRPAATLFRPLLADPGDYRTQVFNGSRLAGAVTTTRGSARYRNTGGRFDSWRRYATDGGRITCWFGPRLGAFPAEFRKVFVGYVDGYPELDADTMTLQFRGRERLLERRPARAFTGDLGTENGVDLEVDGIPGSAYRPIVMGDSPPYFKPVLTNDTDNVWLVQDNPVNPSVNSGVPKIYDGGGEITYSGGIGTSQGGGTYRMLQRANGAVLIQPVTQTRVELRVKSSGRYSPPGVTARAWTIADVVTQAGIPCDPNDDEQFVPGSTNFECGNRVVTNETARDILADVAAFEVAAIGFDRLDRLFAKPIVPSFDGTPAITVRDAGTYPDGKADKLRFARVRGLEKRVWQLKVRGGATTKSALVGDVADDTVRDALSRDGWMNQFTVDVTFNSGAPFFQASTILDSDPTAEVAEVEIKGNQFADSSAREDFGLRYMQLHGARCVPATLELPFGLDTMALGPLDVMRVQTTRFDGQFDGTVIDVHGQLARRRIAFGLWGQETGAPTAAEISITASDDTVGAGGGGGGSGVTGRGDAAPQDMHEFVLFGDKTTALATGESTVDFFFPFNGTLKVIYGGASTAQTSGSVLTFDMKINGASILSTLLTVDNNERSSYTAATPAAISAPSVSKGDRATFHITQVGTGGKGAWVQFVWYPR